MPIAVDPLIVVLKETIAPFYKQRNEPQPGSADTLAVSYACALGDIGDSRATEPLILVSRLRDVPVNPVHWGNRPLSYKEQRDNQIESIQRAAVLALGKIGDVAVVELLLKMLSNMDWLYLHEDVAEALGEIGDKKAVQPLISMLRREKHPSTYIYISDADYCNAARALGKIGDVRAVKPLTSFYENTSNSSFKEEAAWALREINNRVEILTFNCEICDEQIEGSELVDGNVSLVGDCYVHDSCVKGLGNCCKICDFPIEGNYILFEGKKAHDKCVEKANSSD